MNSDGDSLMGTFILTLSLVFTVPTDRFNPNNCAFSRTVCLLAACASYKKQRLPYNYFWQKYDALSVRYELKV